MSDRFTTRDDTVRFTEPFQLEEIHQVEVEKFETVERAAIERVITERQESLVRLQADVLDVRAERNALEHRLSTLESDRGRLQERIRELEATRPALEPKTVFANLGAALQEVDDDLKGERYRVDDVDFTLKTNVTQTEEGVRMHLPSLDESSASANLSEVSFRLRAPRGDAERERPTYVDVPDLGGASHEVAARRLAASELTVGTVEHIADPGSASGTVIEQFPDPYTVAEPEAPVDLVLAAAPDSEPEPDASPEPRNDNSENGDPGDDESEDSESEDSDPEDSESEEGGRAGDADERAQMEAFRRAVTEVVPERGDAVVDRLRRAGVTDFESLTRPDPEEIATKLSVPTDQIAALQERLGAGREPIELEAVSGIGPTYATRLREAGVQSVSQLAALDPATVAKITRAPVGRSDGWIEQARQMAPTE